MKHDNSLNTYSDSIQIASGAFVEKGAVLQENVILGANAVVLSVDQSSGKTAPSVIKTGATIGANATVPRKTPRASPSCLATVLAGA